MIAELQLTELKDVHSWIERQNMMGLWTSPVLFYLCLASDCTRRTCCGPHHGLSTGPYQNVTHRNAKPIDRDLTRIISIVWKRWPGYKHPGSFEGLICERGAMKTMFPAPQHAPPICCRAQTITVRRALSTLLVLHLHFPWHPRSRNWQARYVARVIATISSNHGTCLRADSSLFCLLYQIIPR